MGNPSERIPDRNADAAAIVAALDAKEAKRRLARIVDEASRMISLINGHLLPDAEMSDIAVGRLHGSRDVWRTLLRMASGEI